MTAPFRTLKMNPRELKFSPWNVNVVSPENQRKLEESIRRNGIFRPVVVRELPTGDFEVIAGEHTTRAAVTLGMVEIDVYNLGAIDERKAKEISVIDNQHYGTEDAFGLAGLLKEIDADPGEFLPYSDEDLTEIFKASEIDLDALDMPDADDDSGEIEEAAARAPVDFQMMRFKVPLKDAEFVTRLIETVVRRQGFKSSDSLEAAGDALVHLCRSWSNE